MKYWKQLSFSFFLILLSLVACYFAINYSNAHSYDKILFDILHNLIPYSYSYYIISEVMLGIISILYLGYIIKNNKYSVLPSFFTTLAIFYLIRALLVVIFPLKDPYPFVRDMGRYNYFPAGGMLPSGHAGFVFTIFYAIKGKVKYLFLGLAIFTVFFLVISRLHYTIDIIASIIITYGIYWLNKKYKVF